MARNPWPLKSYANIEFPIESQSQKFSVYQDGKIIETLQSKDGNTWHVLFNLQPQSSSQITISGFESNQEPTSQNGSVPYYLLGIIPAGAIIAGIFMVRRKNRRKVTS